MRKLALFNLVLIVLLVFVSTGRTDDRDDEITAAVKERLLADESLPAAAIDVTTKDGVVTLQGKVIGSKEADDTVALVTSVPGVVSVKSELQVDTQLTNRDVKDRLEKRNETIEKRNEMNEGETPDDRSVIEDAAITANVKMKLAKDEIGSLYRVDVDTKDGVVTLTGTVKTAAEAERLVDLADSVEGVARVSSVLTVKP
jgi:hyperosmotically inducible protein